MAPGWVRISQLHMKEERPWVGKLRERVRVFVDDEGREPACFDHTVGAPYGSVLLMSIYSIWDVSMLMYPTLSGGALYVDSAAESWCFEKWLLEYLLNIRAC